MTIEHSICKRSITLCSAMHAEQLLLKNCQCQPRYRAMIGRADCWQPATAIKGCIPERHILSGSAIDAIQLLLKDCQCWTRYRPMIRQPLTGKPSLTIKHAIPERSIVCHTSINTVQITHTFPPISSIQSLFRSGFCMSSHLTASKTPLS